MKQEIKAELQIFFVLLIVIIAFIFLLATIRTEEQLSQEAVQTTVVSPPTTSHDDDNRLIVVVEEVVEPVMAGFAPFEPLDFTTVATYYLPIIPKFPTPTPNPVLYFEDFADDDDQERWSAFETSDCEVEYNGGRYHVRVKDDDDDNDVCFGPAPEDAEHKLGQFEVKARRRTGSEEFRYGIYINGAGGDEYYLFEIDYDQDDCNWYLTRHDEDDEELDSAGCNSTSNGPNTFNTLRIRHASNGRLSIFLNDEKLLDHTDSPQLNGEGTGVYVREMTTQDDVTIEFDDFTVTNP
jgi:hypothetical protein